MKRARNVLVLIWKQFLPHRPLKGTQTPSSPHRSPQPPGSILELLCENYCIEVWYAYNATLKCRKKIWVLLYLCLSLKSDKLSFMSNFNTWIDFAALIHLGCQSWTMLLWRKNWAPHLIGEPATLPIPTGNCSVWAIVYFTYWLLGMIVL